MSQAAQSVNFEDDLRYILSLAEKPVVSGDELASNLKQIYDAIYGLDFSRYDAAAVKQSAPRLMQAIFEARMRLRDRIPGWQSQGLMTRNVQSRLRDVFRIARYGTDMLGEMAIGHARLSEGDRVLRAFSGTDYNTHVHPRFNSGTNFPFQTGDVLLVRGKAHNSAAIARIGDVDTQFSHIGMVYLDQDGGAWMVEALIEDGAVVNGLAQSLQHSLGRAVLYRHKDPALAARAAEHIHGVVRASQQHKSRHIPYDFSMRLRGKRRLFCSKLVHLAFKDASGGKVRLPAFKTRFDLKNRDFFNRIGVRTRKTFAPGDIDLDPSFDLVAEWQDYRVTGELRRQDLIMDKVFEWMDTHGFRFREDFLIRLIAVFGRLSSHFSDRIKTLISDVVPKVPSNMSRRCIATIAMLHKTAEEIMPSLRALEDNHIRMTGLPLHARDVRAHLERLRETSGGRIGYLVGRA